MSKDQSPSNLRRAAQAVVDNALHLHASELHEAVYEVPAAHMDALREILETTQPQVEVTYIPPRTDDHHCSSVLIPAIKTVRQYGGLSLKEAKEFCEAVRDGMPRTLTLLRGTVEDLIYDLRSIGAKAHEVEM